VVVMKEVVRVVRGGLWWFLWWRKVVVVEEELVRVVLCWLEVDCGG
jgi:hypothetical protein